MFTDLLHIMRCSARGTSGGTLDKHAAAQMAAAKVKVFYEKWAAKGEDTFVAYFQKTWQPKIRECLSIQVITNLVQEHAQA